LQEHAAAGTRAAPARHGKNSTSKQRAAQWVMLIDDLAAGRIDATPERKRDLGAKNPAAGIPVDDGLCM
jgi:hypothetical protein